MWQAKKVKSEEEVGQCIDQERKGGGSYHPLAVTFERFPMIKLDEQVDRNFIVVRPLFGGLLFPHKKDMPQKKGGVTKNNTGRKGVAVYSIIYLHV
jgi:hypothetical protein